MQLHVFTDIILSNARSPLLAHFSAAIAGIGTVQLH